jgi:pepF/M3 family oligoendopeptidase
MTTTATALPHWDMTVVYPSLQSSEFERDFQTVLGDIDELAALFDRCQIEQQEGVIVNKTTVSAFETVLNAISTLQERVRTISAYIYSFVSTDSRDTIAQAKLSELQQRLVKLSQLETRFTAWIGSLDVETLIERSPLAAEHAYYLQRMKLRSRHLMSPAEESLAAELNVSGGNAWEKLHGDFTSQLMVRIQLDGEVREVPMSVARNMAYDPDRTLRQRAYEAELITWEQAAVPLAAALNSIKGETNTLDSRRGWESALDRALFNNSIDRETLDAMLEAAQAAFPDFRRYLQAKAQVLGLPALAWYDLFAPLGKTSKRWDYTAAVEFICEQFGAYSPRLRDVAARAFRENWIDAEPRPGKRDGGFCMLLRGEESRILVNYSPAYDSVSTLAHELGHAYHNYNLAKRPFLLRTAPMTLAETASTFCETIVRQAALTRADREEQLAILEGALQNACQIVVDITSRFIFERSLFEQRRQRELTVSELNELMLAAQRQTYGDGLDQNVLHPYMWAVKTHYYDVERPYYNFPYMFGLLFGLGIYARYQQDPTGFWVSYDELLSSTGMTDAATLAANFGIDIRTPAFWHASLDILRADINRFTELVGSV